VWWCNADFDLTLAHGGGKMPAKIREAAGALSWPLSFWPALAPDDILLLPMGRLPGAADSLEDWRAYLHGAGVRLPRFVPVEGYTGEDGRLFTPFGWNAAAVGMMNDLQARTHHPDPLVVKRVNSRAFSASLEREVSGTEACPTVFCDSRKAVRDWLGTAPQGRYVAKGNHGLAGIGQVRFTLEAPGAEGGDSRRATLERLADRHEGLVIEEECAVTREWGVLFRLSRDGRRSAIRRHRLITSAAGGYAGALALPGDQADREVQWRAHREEASAAVDAVAAALHRAGYWGPVGLDMFVHEGPQGPRLRPLVDLNARQSMAWPVHGLAARFPGRCVLFRQFSATSLTVPRTRDDLQDILSFDVDAGRGALWLTPLLPLARVSVAYIGHDETDVLALHEEFLNTFSRRRDG